MSRQRTPEPEKEGGQAATPGTPQHKDSAEAIHDSARFGKSDPRIERYIDFVLDEVLRLRGGDIGWFYWQKAFVAYALGRRFVAWQAIHAACGWLGQLEGAEV